MTVEIMKCYCGPRSETIGPFIEDYVQSIMTRTTKYNRVFRQEFEYSYYNLFSRERTIYSLMSAAMDRLTPVHESEVPITRRRDRRNPINRDKDQEAGGRIDLWSYKDGIEYFFEFKRSYVDIGIVENDRPAKGVHRQWKKLVRQVREVKSGEANDNACYVGLQIITPFRSRKKWDQIQTYPEITEEHIVAWTRNFDPQLDALLYYKNPNYMRITPTKWNKKGEPERWEVHPLHLFCFTIYSKEA